MVTKKHRKDASVAHITHLRIYPEDGELFSAVKGSTRPGKLVKSLAQEALVLRRQAPQGERGRGGALHSDHADAPSAPAASPVLISRLLSSLDDGA